MGRQAEINALTAQLNQHLRVLATKHATLESRNGYGTVHPREWGKEVDRFLASTGVVLKRLSPADAHKLITRAVEQDRRTGLAARLQSAWEGGALRDPLQFEAACAAKLERLGWTTSLTAKSGDWAAAGFTDTWFRCFDEAGGGDWERQDGRSAGSSSSRL